MLSRRPIRPGFRLIVACVLALGVAGLAIGPAAGWPDPGAAALDPAVDHLVVSEVMTGGSSASDEFVELYNPTGAGLPLEGLEIVYVTASGATVTRKASWAAGADPIAPFSHLLVANEAGIFAPIADLTYANGLAATGGSVALRIQGAATSIDAVGWGSAASAWLETTPAPAPPPGTSLERLPGGAAGSGQDTGNNAVDFVVRDVPDPQNSLTPPVGATPAPSGTPASTVTPSAMPTPSDTPVPTASASPSGTPLASATPVPSTTDTPLPSATASPTPTSTPAPTVSATPGPLIVTIAEARAAPDGSAVTVAGTALTGSAFTDGGGCVVDDTAGIAILVDGGAFDRGVALTAAGTVDDRYAQRTLRVATADVAVTGQGTDPEPMPASTGSIGELTECRLVAITGTIAGGATELTSGLAYEVDDGSGPVRVLVGPSTGIDTSSWAVGVVLSLVGVAGQRDSSGTGTAGYRVMPRDPADVIAVLPVPSPTPSPSDAPSATPSASSAETGSPGPSPSNAPLVSIAEARAATAGSQLRIRGVVTLPTGLVDGATAVIQDASGAIVLRLSDTAGRLYRGTLVEATGIRATKSGMVTLRVADPPVELGSQAEPVGQRAPTGSAGEPLEARLLVVRGLVASSLVRSTAGNVAFTVDDGSGPLRVTVFAGSGIATASLARGTWVEVRGVLGQQTSGTQPERGYRLWPRDAADVAVLADATETADDAEGTSEAGGPVSSATPGRTAADGGSPPAGTGSPGITAARGAAGAGDGGEGSGPADLGIGLATERVPPGAALVLLLSALALGLFSSVLAWRAGTLERLRATVSGAIGGTTESDAADAGVPAAPGG